MYRRREVWNNTARFTCTSFRFCYTCIYVCKDPAACIHTWLDLFVCNLLILCHISHYWGQIGISFMALGRAKSFERKCQNRISWGNSELTGAQWAPSRAVLAYACPKRPNMGQIDPRDIGVDLAFRADLALFILQCSPLLFMLPHPSFPLALS